MRNAGRRNGAAWAGVCTASVLLSLVTLGFASPPSPTQDDALPDGEGRTILQTACTTCHGLGELRKYSAFYTKSQWRELVQTMRDYGARLDDRQAAVLVDYLGTHFSRNDQAQK